ncbi:MAG: ABC transporter permease [Planctomycetota bacterium]|jgi:ABC-type Na+ efflux pump permease subunit
MRFTLDATIKDLRWFFADPSALILAIMIPLIIGGLMSVATGGSGGSMPRAKVLIVDQDEGLLSEFLQGAGDGAQGGDFLDIETVELEEGRARMDEGAASAMLVIPAGFSEAMLKEEPTNLQLVKNPSQTILPEIVHESLEMLREASFYVHRVLGEPIKAIAAGPDDDKSFFDDLRMAALAVQINQQVRALEDILFPPVLELETEIVRENEEEAVPQSFGMLFLPGILLMAMMFLSQSMSETLWLEKDKGTLRRVASAPHSMLAFLAGKLLASFLLMTGISTVGLLLSVWIYDLSWSALPLAMLWLGFSGCTIFCYFVLLQTLASSQRGGSILTMSLLFPLMMIGGAFFPFEAMPQWMQDIGALTPNGLSILELKTIFSGSWQAESLFKATAAIGIPALITFTWTGLRLRGAFLHK